MDLCICMMGCTVSLVMQGVIRGEDFESGPLNSQIAYSGCAGHAEKNRINLSLMGRGVVELWESRVRGE